MQDGVITDLRTAIRVRMYRDRRDSFGCDEPDCTCGRHLTLDLPDAPIDGRTLPRLRHLVRLESMISVGCHFLPNDLDYDQWQDLILLANERQWMEAQVEAQREQIRDAKAKMDAAMAEARKESGVPPPGQSLFGKKR